MTAFNIFTRTFPRVPFVSAAEPTLEQWIEADVWHPYYSRLLDRLTRARGRSSRHTSVHISADMSMTLVQTLVQ